MARKTLLLAVMLLWPVAMTGQPGPQPPRRGTIDEVLKHLPKQPHPSLSEMLRQIQGKDAFLIAIDESGRLSVFDNRGRHREMPAFLADRIKVGPLTVIDGEEFDQAVNGLLETLSTTPRRPATAGPPTRPLEGEAAPSDLGRYADPVFKGRRIEVYMDGSGKGYVHDANAGRWVRLPDLPDVQPAYTKVSDSLALIYGWRAAAAYDTATGAFSVIDTWRGDAFFSFTRGRTRDYATQCGDTLALAAGVHWSAVYDGSLHRWVPLSGGADDSTDSLDANLVLDGDRAWVKVLNGGRYVYEAGSGRFKEAPPGAAPPDRRADRAAVRARLRSGARKDAAASFVLAASYVVFDADGERSDQRLEMEVKQASSEHSSIRGTINGGGDFIENLGDRAKRLLTRAWRLAVPDLYARTSAGTAPEAPASSRFETPDVRLDLEAARALIDVGVNGVAAIAVSEGRVRARDKVTGHTGEAGAGTVLVVVPGLGVSPAVPMSPALRREADRPLLPIPAAPARPSASPEVAAPEAASPGTASLGTALPVPEQEPNDEDAQEQIVKPGDVISGSFSTAQATAARRSEDVDRYRLVQLQKPGQYTITVTPALPDCEYWLAASGGSRRARGPSTVTIELEPGSTKVTERYGGQPEARSENTRTYEELRIVLSPQVFNKGSQGFQCAPGGAWHQEVPYRLSIAWDR